MHDFNFATLADFQKKLLEVALCENEYFSYTSSACIKNWGYISAVACRHVDQVFEKVIRSGMKGPKVRNERTSASCRHTADV